jgi:hypothetical protein
VEHHDASRLALPQARVLGQPCCGACGRPGAASPLSRSLTILSISTHEQRRGRPSRPPPTAVTVWRSGQAPRKDTPWERLAYP